MKNMNKFREANSLRTVLNILFNYTEKDFGNYCSDFHIRHSTEVMAWLEANLCPTTRSNMKVYRDESGKWSSFIELPFLHDEKVPYVKTLVSFKGKQINAIGVISNYEGVVFNNPKNSSTNEMLMENFESVRDYKVLGVFTS